MNKNSFKQAIIVVLIFLLIVAGYIFSQRKKDDMIRKPHYEQYDQSNRLEKIRKGMKK